MATKKYYGVRAGHNIGVYNNWAECEKQVKGYQGAIFKSFHSEEEAIEYVRSSTCSKVAEKSERGETTEYDTEAIAYVDGSCVSVKPSDGDTHPAKYAYGVVIINNGKEIHLKGSGNKEGLMNLRNVAGELTASMVAMQYAYRNNIKSITIVHDYQGIASWCNGDWKAKNEYTQKYKNYYDKISEKVDIVFKKVKGHSNDFYNDVVDALAKQALGVEVKKTMADYIKEIDEKNK